MPLHLQVQTSFRYRNAYWILSLLVVFIVMVKDSGLTLVGHLLFVLLALCLFTYAPFWLAKAIGVYEEQVQEVEISAID